MRPILAVLGVVLGANAGLAFPPSEEVLYKGIYVTRSYDATPLASAPGNRTIDDVVEMLTVIVLDRKAKAGAHEFVEREGGRLEIRATVLEHMQIRRVLKDVGTKPDLAIDLKTELVEFDAAGFEKHVKPAFAATARAAVVIDEKGADAVVKAGKRVQESAARHDYSETAVVSARRTLAVQPTNDRRDHGSPVPPVVRRGYRLVAAMSVSPDRRYVRMKLTEESSDAEGREFVKQTNLRDDGVPLPFLRNVEFGKSASVEVPDEDVVLFRLDYAPKDKVWVVVLRPVIFIQAEHDERNRKK